MATKEVITFQLGHYSNFVGTHWWNLQESCFVYDPKLSESKEINHDVLFREGKNLTNDVTFTPRLIACDLKGSLNTLKQDGTLYDIPEEEDITWTGDVTLHKSNLPVRKNNFLEDLDDPEHDKGEEIDEFIGRDDVEKEDYDPKPVKIRTDTSAEQIFGSKFYSLDSVVNVWSDYLRIHLHPRSLCILNEYCHQDEKTPFDLFGLGQMAATEGGPYWFDIEDKIHYFSEECDQIQGFHILCDTYNGFGGVTSKVLNYLDEEFHKKGLLTFGFSPTVYSITNSQQRANWILNSLLSYDDISSQSSLFLPLSLATELWKEPKLPVEMPWLQYKPHLPYHTSAVLAAALDTLSLPYRIEKQPAHLANMASEFCILGRKIASLFTSFPFPLKTDSDIVGSLMAQRDAPPWLPLTPHSTGSASTPIMQSCVLRGITESKIKRKPNDPIMQKLPSSCSTVEDVFDLYLAELYPQTVNAACIVRTPCHVNAPYPNIFHPNISPKGFLLEQTRGSKQGVETVPMMTSLQTSGDAVCLLSALHKAASKLDIRKHHQFLETGMELDDYHEVLENINTLLKCYQ